MSDNVKTIPLNREGALELNQRPCDICEVGWGVYSSDGKSESCHDKCDYLKRYYDKKFKTKKEIGG